MAKESSSCFNCARSYDAIPSTTEEEDDGTDVSYALGLIFEGYLKLHKTSIPTMNPTNPQYKIGLCADCGTLLSDLTSLYIKFMSLTTAHAELAKLIQDTSLWGFNNHCHQQLHEEEDHEILKQCCASRNQDDDDDDHTIPENFALDQQGHKHNYDAMIDDLKIEVDEEGHIILPYLSEEYFDPSPSPSNSTEGNGVVKKNLYVRLERLNPIEIKSFVSKKPNINDDDRPVSSKLQRTNQTSSSKSSTKHIIRRRERKKEKQAKPEARQAGKSLSCPHPQCTSNATNVIYSTSRHLAAHIKTAHPSTYPCKYCPEAFPTELILAIHMNKAHPGIKILRDCSFCPKTFVNNRSLKSHILVKHTPDFNGLTCFYCSKIYTTNTILNAHILKFHAAALLQNQQENNMQMHDDDAQMKQQQFEIQQQTCKNSTKRGNPNYCKLCAFKFPTKMKYLAHKALKHPKVKRRWPCTLCNDSFCDRPRLRTHYKLIHGGIGVSLPMMSQQIQQDLNLGSGKASVNDVNDDDRTCDVCGKLFVYPSEVKSHKEEKHSNSAEDVFKSEMAKRAKINARNHHLRLLKSKYEIKSNEKLCAACVRGFKDLLSLKVHRETLHPQQQQCKTTTTIEEEPDGPTPSAPSETDYQQCTQCSQENITRYFINSLYLQRHTLLTHDKQNSSTTTTTTNHFCNECGKGFRWINDYKSHLRNDHSSISTFYTPKSSSFQCDECGKCFTTHAGLQQHLADPSTKHEANRTMKFQCVDCSSWFLSEKSYQTHLQLHNRSTTDVDSVKNYSCKLCGKLFHIQGHLQRHLKVTHAPPDHRPYICQLCGKGFKASHLLKVHLNTKGHGGPGEPPRKPRKRQN